MVNYLVCLAVVVDKILWLIPHTLNVARERVELVLDEDSPFLELCALAGYDQDDMTLGKIISHN